MISAQINIHVIPKSSRSTLVINARGFLRAYLHSPPEDRKANYELISLLSKALKIPKRDITIECGLTSRNKSILIQGITVEMVIHLISNF